MFNITPTPRIDERTRERARWIVNSGHLSATDVDSLLRGEGHVEIAVERDERCALYPAPLQYWYWDGRDGSAWCRSPLGAAVAELLRGNAP